jgi:hypothetical protein
VPALGSGVLDDPADPADPACGCPCCGAGDPQTVNVRTRIQELPFSGKKGGVKNTALRRVFGYMREEISSDWKKLHKKTYHNLCSSPDII